jgi:hypothetical protein
MNRLSRRVTLVCCAASLVYLLILPGGASAAVVNGNAGAWIGGFVGALFGELFARHIVVNADRRAQAQLLRDDMTREDEMNLKQLATSLEEYAVDHNGVFPKQLSQLEPLYLRAMLWVPGSDPPAQYRYEMPAARPAWGQWDIVDDGSLDPTLTKLRALDNTLCTHATCKYIVYAESQGLVGAPP